MRQIRFGVALGAGYCVSDSDHWVELLRTNAAASDALKTDKAAWKRNMVRTAILLAHPVKG